MRARAVEVPVVGASRANGPCAERESRSEVSRRAGPGHMGDVLGALGAGQRKIGIWKMNAAPRLTIGLPVYNGEKYLAESLDALLGQSYADFELIISDNASTDGTADICRQYGKQDSRIRY